MKKILMGILTIGLLGCSGEKEGEKKVEEGKKANGVNIGITQIVDHPSLNEIRRGIEEGVKEEGVEVNFIYENAQNDFTIAQDIGGKFESDKEIKAVMAITTPSAQAIKNQVKTKPIFYAGVSDPEKAGLTSERIKGVRDTSPIEKQLDFLEKVMPDAKNIGVIYNTSEVNSVDITERLVVAAKKRGLNVVKKGVTTVSEIPLAVDAINGDVDVLYTGKDNLIASAYPILVKKADGYKIPVIGATKDFVKKGAFASVGTSEYANGYQAGKMLARFINGEKIEDIKSEKPNVIEYVVNEKKFEKYNMSMDALKEVEGVEVIN